MHWIHLRKFIKFICLTPLLVFIGCKDDKVDRMDISELDLIPGSIIHYGLTEADRLLTHFGYTSAEPVEPFNIGYVRGDTSFVYLLSDSTHAGMIVALQIRDIETSFFNCVKNYLERSTSNHVISWQDWQGSIQTDTSLTTYSDYKIFFVDLMADGLTHANLKQVTESGQTNVMQYQQAAMPINETLYTVIYVININE